MTNSELTNKAFRLNCFFPFQKCNDFITYFGKRANLQIECFKRLSEFLIDLNKVEAEQEKTDQIEIEMLQSKKQRENLVSN